jgi:hypothetical protein
MLGSELGMTYVGFVFVVVVVVVCVCVRACTARDILDDRPLIETPVAGAQVDTVVWSVQNLIAIKEFDRSRKMSRDIFLCFLISLSCASFHTEYIRKKPSHSLHYCPLLCIPFLCFVLDFPF